MTTCPREDDVLVAVGTGRWPDRTDAELRAHVVQCAVCADLVTVTHAFKTNLDDADAQDRRVLPDGSLVWWRAQLRAREEAARVATRPITAAQAISFASVVGVLGLIVGATSSWLQAGMHWIAGVLVWLDPRGLSVPPALVTAAAEHAWLVGMIAMVFLLVPVGLYLATREPRT
jgi:lysylphosphatidylglycerol synthetase-like protein (DUF2156 family)